MRKLGSILLCFGLILPTHAAKRVSVEQLEQTLAQAAARPDAELAWWQLSDLQLTERLSPSENSRLEQTLPGEKSRQALRILADTSAFLDPPTSELPSQTTPDLAEQRRIMGLVAAYVSKTIPQLPNFFATRRTTHYEDTPQFNDARGFLVPYQPVHIEGESQVTVFYRDGREIVDAGTDKKSRPKIEGLTTWGTFGPILGTVLVDAAESRLAWSHWDRDTTGSLAVFTYSVARETSHYEVNYCCVANESATEAAQTRPFRQLVGYHGELSVDPSSGTILRLTVEADLKSTAPVSKAAILVVYGPVEIGGKSYACPVRSISMTLAQTLQVSKDYKFALANQLQPLKTSLNDVAFLQYHVFRAEAHVLTGDGAIGGEKPATSASTPGDARAEYTDAATESAKPATMEAKNGVPITPVIDRAPISAPAPSAASLSPPAAAPAPKPAEEISVTASSDLPNAPVSGLAAPGAELTLRTTSRLVDVAVVAYDRKGRPVTDLKPEDLEVYDEGRKQSVRFFGQASASAPGGLAAKVADASPKPEQTTFSNHSTGASLTAGTTILLIDSSNLAFGDLTYAREEMLRFLKMAAPDERIGLYVLKSYEFEILAEPTTDHAQLGGTLTKWMPSAQDLAHAQDEEKRNRQQFDYIHSVADLSYVNGNLPTGQFDYLAPVDPQLRSFGNNPARDVLAILPGIARHLAGSPGHKTLVWIASDNVLADFSDKAPHGEKGPSYLDHLDLAAREALNEAHISIYPLDASQLEPGGVSASLFSASVQAAPGSNIDMQIATLPSAERQELLDALDGSNRNVKPGRVKAQMQQDTHSIRGEFRELAAATGGRAFRRAGDIAAELDNVVADGRAAYLLSFTPDVPPDDTYHHLTVKIVGRPDISVRYRTGYFYGKEPATMKERLRQAIWQPADTTEIGLSATPIRIAGGSSLKLTVAATDLGLAQQGDRWIDKLDIFLIKRDDASMHVEMTGQTLGLQLKSATYANLMRNGLNFDEPIQAHPESGDLRVLVVDGNTGRIGSISIPASALRVQ